ncbi:MAG TPA: LLM class flavin-dependent oxidoreductase [Acidimicrobiales bacterium]|nr:LLM class flavin-dependent oxidoreductase [Acidimicrobiales bacterium]
MIKISVLDQSPVASGSDATEALANTVELARLAERLGYHRYWLAEHHATTGLAGSAPEVLVAHVAASTRTIRVGSGGVMLPHYSPFKVAEQFRTLAALHPGRIDLGVGRAPGGTARAAVALRRDREIAMRDDFPAQVTELLAWLHDDIPERHPFRAVRATPVPRSAPAPWILSSSGYGAELAAQLGTALCFAHFINPVGGPEAVSRYVKQFVSSRALQAPEASIAVSVVCAPTTPDALRIATPVMRWRQRLRFAADPGPVPSLEEVDDDPEGSDVGSQLTRLVVGDPEHVARELVSLAASYGVDEVLVVTITHDHGDRLRSYELVAQALGSSHSR